MADFPIYGRYSYKMHKFSSHDSFSKICPIFSSIGTFNHNLACFLCDLLSPLVPNDYLCKAKILFLLILKLRMNIFPENFLFPLQETIDIAINFIFNHNPNLNITKKELKKLFLFTSSQTHFIFNSKFYGQIDVVDIWVLLWFLLLLIFSWVLRI